MARKRIRPFSRRSNTPHTAWCPLRSLHVVLVRCAVASPAMKESFDPEKDVVVEKASRVSTSSLSEDVPPQNDGLYANEELNDPEETLHRGLSARQISMIAVCADQCSLFIDAHIPGSSVAPWVRGLSWALAPPSYEADPLASF